MRDERSSCAGQPPDRGMRLHEQLHRDPNATSYGATCRYTCCRERERCATRAPAIPPPEHIRRNHRNIARLYTFAVLQQVLPSIESIL